MLHITYKLVQLAKTCKNITRGKVKGMYNNNEKYQPCASYHKMLKTLAKMIKSQKLTLPTQRS